VLSLHATVGAEAVPGGDALAEVGDPEALQVVADVPETSVDDVKAGAGVTIELPSLKAPLQGTVTSVGAVVASAVRSAQVRIALTGAHAGVRPGMFGRAHIATATHGLTLPTQAVLLRDGKDTVVYVEARPQHFVRRAVAVGPPAGGQVHVLSGLAAGDLVVVKGALLLDGAADQLL